MQGSVRRSGIVVVCAFALGGGSACAALMNIDEPTLVDEAGVGSEGGGVVVPPSSGDDSGGPVGPTSCTPSPDSCPPGSFCSPSNECALGCRMDADCTKLVPNGSAPKCAADRHECVECLATPDCASKPGTVCSPGGACVASCSGDGGTCDAGTCCSGFCIDTKTDVKNCNACGNACTGASPHCCGSACADTTTSSSNCGGCNIVCGTQNASKTSCSAGFCAPTCSTGFSHCTTGAAGCETSTTNDPVHCGSCTTNCNTKVVGATMITCSQSKCTYQGACTDFHYDANGDKSDGCETPCGAKGMGCCPSGPQCMAGLMCNPAQGCK